MGLLKPECKRPVFLHESQSFSANKGVLRPANIKNARFFSKTVLPTTVINYYNLLKGLLVLGFIGLRAEVAGNISFLTGWEFVSVLNQITGLGSNRFG